MNAPQKNKRAIEPAKLADSILDQLARGPAEISTLANVVGYTSTCVRRRLYELEKADLVYRQRITSRYGFMYRWHLGPEPEVVIDLSTVDLAPRQTSSRNFPAVGKRDPLVAALFGAPRAAVIPASLLEMER